MVGKKKAGSPTKHGLHLPSSFEGKACSLASHHKTYDFHIEYVQILDEQGCYNPQDMPDLTDQQTLELYRFMVLSRAFDDKALKLQRQGRLGTYAPVLGQEATQVGSAYALGSRDWLFPSFRENASLIVRGMPMQNLFQYWGGDERGHLYQGLQNFPISIPISTQMLHAVGVGMAARIQKDDVAVLVHFGDGGTSEGDFHEAMNFAGVFNAPVVFFCTNNQWAISVPREQQTHTQTLAQKALAYGFPGIQVDGNDVFSVYKVTHDALEHARKSGPIMVEALTYRMGDHTTADDAKRYRTEEMLKPWRAKDPLLRLRRYLEKKNLWDATKEQILHDACEAEVKKAVDAYEETPPPSPGDFFDFTFAKLPDDLRQQKEKLLQLVGKSQPSPLEHIQGGFP